MINLQALDVIYKKIPKHATLFLSEQLKLFLEMEKKLFFELKIVHKIYLNISDCLQISAINSCWRRFNSCFEQKFTSCFGNAEYFKKSKREIYSIVLFCNFNQRK